VTDPDPALKCGASRTVLTRTLFCETHHIPLRRCELNQARTLLEEATRLIDRWYGERHEAGQPDTVKDTRLFLARREVREILTRSNPRREVNR
jgi:hypothetical protein